MVWSKNDGRMGCRWMIDREKVIYSIERCISHVPDACRDCAYDSGHPYNECVEMMLTDVLALLKEQEAVEPIKDEVGLIHCGNCNAMLEHHPFYCWNCGQEVKWDG